MGRHVRLALFIVVVAALAAAGPGSLTGLAQEATPEAGSVVLPPDAAVAGLALAGWSARSWQWYFSLPAAVNPFFDETGEICGYGQSGPVFFLVGAEQSLERSCVVPAGVHVYVPLLGSECSTVEEPPFFGRDEAELRQCASDAITMAGSVFDMSAMRLILDGQAVENLAAYRAATPLFTLWLPADNVLGSPERAADAVGDGYQVMLGPLAPGEHLIAISLPGPRGEQPISITYRLTVVSGAFTDAAA